MKKENIKTKKYNKVEKETIINIINILDNYYPDAKCSLDYIVPIQLVVSLILAAQCTDERVNTPLYMI